MPLTKMRRWYEKNCIFDDCHWQKNVRYLDGKQLELLLGEVLKSKFAAVRMPSEWPCSAGRDRDVGSTACAKSNHRRERQALNEFVDTYP